MKINKEELRIEITDIIGRACNNTDCDECPFNFKDRRNRRRCAIGELRGALDIPNYTNLIVPIDFWRRTDIM